MSLTLTIANETSAEETRVALTPDIIAKLLKKHAGLSITVEEGAGTAAGFSNKAYEGAGATVLKPKAWLGQQADILIRLTPPTGREKLPLKAGGIFIGLNPGNRFGGTTLALERLPRTSRAQALDVLSSQANLAGYAAVIMAAGHLPRLMPMLMTAAGSSKPASVLILGVGVAGLQAIATAKRLGAQVHAFDVRPETAEQITSLGAKPLQIDMSAARQMETSGGYAGKLDEERTKALQEALTPAIQAADVVITTAQVPGAPAPVLVTAGAARGMKPASVLLDMAAAGYNRANKIKGGNCPLSVAGEVTVLPDGPTILAPLNLAAHLAGNASQFFATNMANLLGLLLKTEEGTLATSLHDELISAMKVA